MRSSSCDIRFLVRRREVVMDWAWWVAEEASCCCGCRRSAAGAVAPPALFFRLVGGDGAAGIVSVLFHGDKR